VLEAMECVSSGADQDMLSRIQQELNARFLQDRSLLPLGLPPVPFTLHTEMHQHQHLHHHQHVLTPGTYLPTPAAQSAAGPGGLFQPPMSEVKCSWKWLTECSTIVRISVYISHLPCGAFSGDFVIGGGRGCRGCR